MPTSRDAYGPPFVVVDGDSGSRVIIHVPHASTFIPSWVRERIVLSDEDLALELVAMTDAATDRIAREASNLCGKRPWLFINQRSRLVVDPERFPDPVAEVMSAPEIGMGAVYTRTANGQVLREPDAAHEDELLATFFRPYSQALAQLVGRRLDDGGQVTIVDLHSYPVTELAYERGVHADAPRPACCIGTDADHTPPALADAVAVAFADLGEPLLNEPFAGTYVPLQHYGTELRVRSVMVELRRDTYVGSAQDLARVTAMLATLVDSIDTHDGERLSQTEAMATGCTWAITPPPDHTLILQLEPISAARRADQDATFGLFRGAGFTPVVRPTDALDPARTGVTCRIDSPRHLTIVFRQEAGPAIEIPVPHDNPALTTAVTADGFVRTYATTDSIGVRGLIDSAMMTRDMAGGVVLGARVAVVPAPSG